MSEIPRLEGWVTLPEVAEVIDMSVPSVNSMAAKGEFWSLRRLGQRPLYVVSEEELEQLRANPPRKRARRGSANGSVRVSWEQPALEDA